MAIKILKCSAHVGKLLAFDSCVSKVRYMAYHYYGIPLLSILWFRVPAIK